VLHAQVMLVDGWREGADLLANWLQATL